jgi:hypothetical protein
MGFHKRIGDIFAVKALRLDQDLGLCPVYLFYYGRDIIDGRFRIDGGFCGMNI